MLTIFKLLYYLVITHKVNKLEGGMEVQRGLGKLECVRVLWSYSITLRRIDDFFVSVLLTSLVPQRNYGSEDRDFNFDGR